MTGTWVESQLRKQDTTLEKDAKRSEKGTRTDSNTKKNLWGLFRWDAPLAEEHESFGCEHAIFQKRGRTAICSETGTLRHLYSRNGDAKILIFRNGDAKHIHIYDQKRGRTYILIYSETGIASPTPNPNDYLRCKLAGMITSRVHGPCEKLILMTHTTWGTIIPWHKPPVNFQRTYNTLLDGKRTMGNWDTSHH